MSPINKEKFGLILILLFALASIIGLASQRPISQDVTYHHFGDARTLFAIQNFWNVLSNLPFLIVGLIGLYKLFNTDSLKLVQEMRLAYFFLFFGIVLVAFGSGYYHLTPDNQTLVWDRLPMTIAFMALFSIILAEFISIKIGTKLLWPLLIAGIASVAYWHITEQQGVGDLRFYAVIQFFPMLVIPVILIFFKSRFSHVSAYWLLIACYALAKVFEYFDKEFYSFLGFTISGHSIKHMIVALGLYVLLHGYTQRKQIALEKS